MYQITACVVTYHNKTEILKKTIESFINSSLNVRLFISDNSKNNSIQSLCRDPRIEYYYNNFNLGFGKAHNKVIEKIVNNSEYHLILNPDVYFDANVLEDLYNYMSVNKDVGLISPKTLYADGKLQKSCRLIPSPVDLIIRRIKWLPEFLKKRVLFQELTFTHYTQIMEVPFLLGSFLFFRNSVLQNVKGFDERFFMYLEDLDICRRIASKTKVIFYPDSSVYHIYEKGSTRNVKLLLIHFTSMIKYFNKWGWFYDKEKKEINKKVLNQFKNRGITRK